jgi:hypothetical protein
LKNINPRANELKHDLNFTGDSLYFSCERTILKVEIFNDEYERIIEVNKKHIKIPLETLPGGRFLIEAKLTDKLIVMTLIRETNSKTKSQDLTESSDLASSKIDAVKVSELKKEVLEVNLNNPIATVPLQNSPKTPQSYWVEYHIRNGNSSYKTSRFANKEMVEKMIARNKLEINTTQGKLNNLKIWEVYNTRSFLLTRRANSDFSQIRTSEYFNSIPYYSSNNFLASR